jgi:phosphoribosylanthranilate isomerase
MDRLKLKVCGMRGPETSDVVGLGVDYVGFIFYDQSPRFVGEEFSFDKPPGDTQMVGVFVNQGRASIVQSLKRINSRIAQLHGDEKPEECEALRDLGYTVIKAIPVDGTFDGNAIAKFHDVVDYFLFDRKGKHYGGNAARFDWNVLNRYDQRTPFFLSGGIRLDDLENLRSVRNMNIHAVDVNSGVENAPGAKDILKVKAVKLKVDKL